MDRPRLVSFIVAWWAARPTQRRLGHLKARRIELKARIEIAKQARNTNALHVLYGQLQHTTHELLRLERGRIA